MKKIMELIPTLIICLIVITGCSDKQSDYSDWVSDIDLLTEKIEKYHPNPWANISKEDFFNKVENIKNNIPNLDEDEKVLELMKLVASIKDGHTQVTLNNRDEFNLWFPIRIESFYDGFYITIADNDNNEIIEAEVLSLGGIDMAEVCRRVGEIISVDHSVGLPRVITNYLSNAVILEKLGIIEDRSTLIMNVHLRNGEIKQVALKSEPWQMAFNWAYNKTASPTGNEVITIFDKEIDSLPLYLSNVVPSRVPYWFRYIPDDRMIYFQYNDVTNGSGESFTDFTSRLFEMYDTHEDKIDKFVIDLRFNEGGDGSLLPPLVREFVLRDDSFDRGKLFIITGSNTFSAAPNFIGKMLKNTSVITVGDIAAGPLNWCSDIIKFSLPNSKLMINISTMAWQEGHPTDNRGYYPPDYYVPTVSVEYFSFVDPVLEAIRENKVSTLKDILYNEGCEQFWSEYQVRKEAFVEQENWFPYNSFDLLLFAFQSLAAAGKIDESMAISELNTTLYPDKIRAWYILAMMHEAKGEFMEALECYNMLLSIEPDYTEAIWERDKMKALADKSELDASLLKLYSGQYGERRIIQEDNILYYQGSGTKMKLIPISEDYFLIDGSSTRINFMLESGACIAIKMHTYNGSSKTYMRSGE